MSSPAPADRPRSGLSRRQALAGLGFALIGGVAGQAASARAAVAPARRAGAGLAAGLTNLQLAGQRVIGSYPGLTPPASLFTDISNGQVAGVIFFGENISSETQIAGVITQLRQAQAQAQSPVQVPLLLMTDQEGGLVRRLPGGPVLSEKQIGQSSDPVAAAAAAGTGAGQNLAGVGMNVNLAPVLDVYYKTGNFIDQYQRSYSHDPAVVSECGQAFITASSRPAWRRSPSTSPAWARPPRTRTPTTAR
jgi:beta-N-acetylhexosaminidase